MKDFIKTLVLVGVLALVLVVRAYASSDQVQPFQTAAGMRQVVTLTPLPQNPGQPVATPASSAASNRYSWGQWMGQRMMGGGMMGSGMMGSMNLGGMHGGYGSNNMQPMMTGVSHVHDDIALQLGITTQDLYNHMVSGKSLVQIAAERGITEQQLTDGIMTGRRLAYEQAVRNGYMTQSQADAMLQSVHDNLKAMITGQGTGSSGWGMMWDIQP